jgi:hypothetical protein
VSTHTVALDGNATAARNVANNPNRNAIRYIPFPPFIIMNSGTAISVRDLLTPCF